MDRTCSSPRCLRGRAGSKPEQPFAIMLDVVAVQETFAMLGHHSPKPELAVDQRQIPKVFAVTEICEFPKPRSRSTVVDRRSACEPRTKALQNNWKNPLRHPTMRARENIERIKHRLGASEQEITELRLGEDRGRRSRHRARSGNPSDREPTLRIVRGSF